MRFCSQAWADDTPEERHASPEQVQEVSLCGITIVLIDTRWHRTVMSSSASSQFMHWKDLEPVIDLLRDTEHLVVLAVSRPAAGFRRRFAWKRAILGAQWEDYQAQYLTLWRALNHRADKNFPTVLLAGDIHSHGLGTALDGKLLQIVSSPMSLLDSLDPSGWFRDRLTIKNSRAAGSASSSRFSGNRISSVSR